MQGDAGRCDEIDAKPADADDEWDIEEMISADEIAKSVVREKIKVTRRIWDDGGEAMRTFMLEVIDLSREIKWKRDKAKLMDRNNDLITELEESRASERVVRD